ncbi:type II toxin-antitoxin system VapC family toxin [Neoroseomonas marina]|uniref:type II toxin-antitoxin system VapC family toxin n=1 Tax=Neoroseomonas marina TaxID=1232220 RepID=UPI001B7D5EC7|nr:type II toxin-antitoxin system VapC family toxin [Neoroseomonas marina]
MLINDPNYAEFAEGFRRIEEVDPVLGTAQIELAPIPREAQFLAGKAFQRYRASDGGRTGVLPDFFIGAHATVASQPLLTRDVRRYRNYFPTVPSIAQGP